MISASRRDPLHHAAADTDEVVLEPEVGQERDVLEHLAPPGELGDGRDEPVQVVRRRLDRDVEADRARDPRRLGPDRDGRAAPPIQAYARAAEPDASTTTSPAGGSGWSSTVL